MATLSDSSARIESGIDATIPSSPGTKKPNCLGFFSPPKQRQRWGDTQILPHVNWGDLFFDLFYVGAAYNLGSIIRYSPTNQGLLYFVGAFSPVVLMWTDKMHFDSRFATDDDPYHRIFEVVMLCILATAVLHIRTVDIMSHPSVHAEMFVFSLSSLLASVFSILRYVEVWIWVIGQPSAKTAAKKDILRKVVPTIFFLAATIVSGADYYPQSDNDSAFGRFLAGDGSSSGSEISTNDVPIYLCLAATLSYFVWLCLEVSFCVGGDFKQVTVPMNIDFAIHRYGEWTMLMLGESVLSLLIVEVSDGSKYYITFYAGVLSVILLQYMYFRSQPHHADEHALRRDRNAGVLWTMLIIVYSAALIIVGVAYKMLLYEYTYEDDGGDHRLLHRSGLHLDVQRVLAGSDALSEYGTEDRQQRVANFFCASLAVVWFTSDMMILAHKGLKDNAGRCRCKVTGKVSFISVLFVLLRTGLLVFIATLSLYVNDPEQLSLIGLAGIVAQVSLRAAGDVFFPKDQVHASDVNQPEEDSEDEKWPNVTHPRSKSLSFNDPSNNYAA